MTRRIELLNVGLCLAWPDDRPTLNLRCGRCGLTLLAIHTPTTTNTSTVPKPDPMSRAITVRCEKCGVQHQINPHRLAERAQQAIDGNHKNLIWGEGKWAAAHQGQRRSGGIPWPVPPPSVAADGG